jgi:hypothetical protein
MDARLCRPKPGAYPLRISFYPGGQPGCIRSREQKAVYQTVAIVRWLVMTVAHADRQAMTQRMTTYMGTRPDFSCCPKYLTGGRSGRGFDASKGAHGERGRIPLSRRCWTVPCSCIAGLNLFRQRKLYEAVSVPELRIAALLREYPLRELRARARLSAGVRSCHGAQGGCRAADRPGGTRPVL